MPAGQRTSSDGKCGTGLSCIGYSGGTCCSQFGYCGNGEQFCGKLQGCQPEFGLCEGNLGNAPPAANDPPPTQTEEAPEEQPPVEEVPEEPPVEVAPPPTPVQPPASSSSGTLRAGQRTSTDGKCGSSVSCVGYAGGSCCSQFGYCGSGDQFCGKLQGCQDQFGYCFPT